ncbi:MAG: hypothetical protein HFG74_03945 [Hungatella sp.]|nr:hypothetical protein [Hungatella sp.]
MEVNTERIMILLQRRYSAIRELDRLTSELEETIIRNDGISAAMVLQLREDEMEKADRCMEEIRQMGESDRESYEKVCSLVDVDPAKAVGGTKEEEKIFEIRRKTQAVIEKLRRTDQRLNFRVAGDKSFYKTAEPVR